MPGLVCFKALSIPSLVAFKVSEIYKIAKLLKKIDDDLIKKKSKLARKFALKYFSYEYSKKNYLKIFDKVLKEKKK